MRPRVPLRKSLSDKLLLGGILDGPSWLPWRVLLIASQGEPLDDSERAIFKQLTGGREREPLVPVEEFVGVIGRRGGKSPAPSAVLAAYCRRAVRSRRAGEGRKRRAADASLLTCGRPTSCLVTSWPHSRTRRSCGS